MTLGAVFAWGWLPSLQEAPESATRVCEIPTLPNKTLETLAQGRQYATEVGGEVLTFRGKMNAAKTKFDMLRNGGFAPRSREQVIMPDMEMEEVNVHGTTIGSP
jgi:hypothetical protein